MTTPGLNGVSCDMLGVSWVSKPSQWAGKCGKNFCQRMIWWKTKPSTYLEGLKSKDIYIASKKCIDNVEKGRKRASYNKPKYGNEINNLSFNKEPKLPKTLILRMPVLSLSIPLLSYAITCIVVFVNAVFGNNSYIYITWMIQIYHCKMLSCAPLLYSVSIGYVINFACFFGFCFCLLNRKLTNRMAVKG